MESFYVWAYIDGEWSSCNMFVHHFDDKENFMLMLDEDYEYGNDMCYIFTEDYQSIMLSTEDGETTAMGPDGE